MLQRLHIHNYKAFQDFEFKPGPEKSSCLLIGKNGSGKSTIGDVFELLKKIGQFETRTEYLVHRRQLPIFGDAKAPMCFGIDVNLDGQNFFYYLALDLPEPSKNFRVVEETLTVNDALVFERKFENITLMRGVTGKSVYSLNKDTVSLPQIHVVDDDPVALFRSWLSRIMVIAPIPSVMNDGTTTEDKNVIVNPERNVANLVDWLFDVHTRFPATYASMLERIKEYIPDLKSFAYEPGRYEKQLVLQFDGSSRKMPFSVLSDGEKCFFVFATLLAMAKLVDKTEPKDGLCSPFLCFWDEPDNYLSVPELETFVRSLRYGFQPPNQLLITSHSLDTIIKYNNENTWVISRETHLESPKIRSLKDVRKDMPGDLATALLMGDLF